MTKVYLLLPHFQHFNFKWLLLLKLRFPFLMSSRDRQLAGWNGWIVKGGLQPRLHNHLCQLEYVLAHCLYQMAWIRAPPTTPSSRFSWLYTNFKLAAVVLHCTGCNTAGCGPKYTNGLDVLDSAITREYLVLQKSTIQMTQWGHIWGVCHVLLRWK